MASGDAWDGRRGRVFDFELDFAKLGARSGDTIDVQLLYSTLGVERPGLDGLAMLKRLRHEGPAVWITPRARMTVP